MEKIRLGYIGCGFMAQKVHIPNFASIPDCELIGLAEVRAELGKTVQTRFGIPQLYSDHSELAQNADIEAVAVSADFALQGEIAKDLLLAGKHVFMEKPMAVSTEQAEADCGGIAEVRQEVDGRLHETLRCGQRDRQGEGGTIPRDRRTRTLDLCQKSRLRRRLGLQP